MNKYKIILILLLAFKINTSYAQWGVDASFSPLNYNVFFKSEDESNFANGQYNGFKIGYFNWQNEGGMFKISLQVNSFKNELFTINNDIYNNPKAIKENYKYDATNFILRYEGIGVFNEIDFKSHFFFKSAYLIGVRSTKLVSTGSEEIDRYSQKATLIKNNFDGSKLDGTSVIFGIEYGLGYQYNITKLLGAYVDASVGFALPAYIYYDTNLGVRYRIK